MKKVIQLILFSFLIIISIIFYKIYFVKKEQPKVEIDIQEEQQVPNTENNLISLKGNVIIKRDQSVLTGEQGYFNLSTRKSKIESSKSKRVKGVFSPIQK